MLDLVTAGEAFDDFIFHGLTHLPRRGEELKTTRFWRSPGGGAVITAVAASRLGLRCGILSGVSRDTARMLRAEGVQVNNLRRAREPAALSVAISTPRDRSFVTFIGMNDRLPPRLRAGLTRFRAHHVHMAFIPRRCRPWIAVVERLRRLGTTTSWDFGWHPALRGDRDFAGLAESVDYLFVNRDEAMLYAKARTFGRALERWRRAPRCVVVKLGASGSRAVGRAVNVRAAAVRVHVVDTTGAGDAFNAGFLVARLRGRHVPAALRLANRIGALSTRRPGGIAGLPKMAS